MCERLRYTWAFDLSVYIGFRQVPLNVDELNCPRSYFWVFGGVFVLKNNMLRIKTIFKL